MESFEIVELKEELRSSKVIANLVGLWNDSVKATHKFLTEQNIKDLLPFVEIGLKQVKTLLLVVDDDDFAGFIGIENQKIEMLFLSPKYFKKGIGKKLINIAISKYNAIYVDVNEQNPNAAGFYQHMGFRVFDRSELDDQGNSFPILHMKLDLPHYEK